MPTTALQHFLQDIARAGAIVAHADRLPIATPTQQLLRSDLLRSGWMFAVGALDAYFCDAYTDVVAATITSKSRQNSITLPAWLYEIKFPIAAIVEEYTYSNWRWRMAGTVVKVIQDVEFFVKRCDEHIDAEFRQFMQDAGCSSATIAAAGY